jgi:hypothetical protein
VMENFLCLDCSAIGELRRNGTCGKCGSSAVLSMFSHKPILFPITPVDEIRELNRIFAL